MKGLNKLSLSFAAGCVGGVLIALLVYLIGALGVMKSYGVQIAPALTADWLYQQTVIGGLWGLLFALPWFDKMNWILCALIVAIFPILAQLFVIFPLVQNVGVMGSQLGNLTVYFVIIFGAIWGLISAAWLRLSR